MTEDQETYKAELIGTPAYPEAPASATVRYRLEGFDWMFTIRSFDSLNPGKDLLTKQKVVNEALKQMGAEPIFGNNYRPPAGPPPKQKPKPKAEEKAEEELPEKKDCPIHPGMYLKLHKKGKQHWYSHKLDDGTWCKGE